MKTSLRFLACTAALAGVGIATAAPVLNPGNGHYYEYVASGKTWADAVSASAAMSHMGMAGYLVTVTSEAESDFIYGSVTSATVWAGGSDAADEGVWKWVTGPEAGTTFWDNGSTLTYARWSGGEPNNSGNEDAVHINWSGPAWNDIPDYLTYGYVVEYSPAVPEPATYALFALGLAGLGFAARRRA